MCIRDSGSIESCPSPVFQRRAAELPGKDRRKFALIFVAHLCRDLGHPQFGVPQQLCRPAHPRLPQEYLSLIHILLLCRAEGTGYEQFIHNMVEVEVEATLRYMEVLRHLGRDVPELSRSLYLSLIHISSTSIRSPRRRCDNFPLV